jgi:hypothetical protein
MSDEEFRSIARVLCRRWLVRQRWQHEYGHLGGAAAPCPPGERSAVQIMDLCGHGRVRRGADFPEDEDRGPPGWRCSRRRGMLGNARNALRQIVSRNPDRRAPTQLYCAAREVAESGNRQSGNRHGSEW